MLMCNVTGIYHVGRSTHSGHGQQTYAAELQRVRRRRAAAAAADHVGDHRASLCVVNVVSIVEI